jgi:CRP/FNR family cyclic AMP-dependent transcriptional regulator
VAAAHRNGAPDAPYGLLHRQDFLDLVEHNPAMGVKMVLRLAQILSRHLRKTNQDVVKLTTALAVSLGG